jgi:hypothetical protein
MTHDEAWTLLDGWTFEIDSSNRYGYSPDRKLMGLEIGKDGTCDPHILVLNHDNEGGWPDELDDDQGGELTLAWQILWYAADTIPTREAT